MASKASLASSWLALLLAYQVDPPEVDWPAAYVSICMTVFGVPPNTELEFSKAAHVRSWQILVKSTDRPPTGADAPVLLPPRAGSLKYTLSAVASICPLSIAFMELPEASAAF